MSEITCRNLTMGYDSNILVRDLSFNVDHGDYLCIVGENGTGKSTLMRTLLNLQQPISGTVEYGDGLAASEIGYLPQQTLVQRDFPASVREIVLSGCQGRSHGFFYSKADKKLAEDKMEQMGIRQMAGRCYRELSGGQQQRVLLARALCATQKLILLDEPVSGLDPRVTAEMYSLLSELNQSGISIIMISHDIQAAVRYGSHILHLGKHVFFGTKEEYVNSKVYKKLYEYIAENDQPDLAGTGSGDGRRGAL